MFVTLCILLSLVLTTVMCNLYNAALYYKLIFETEYHFVYTCISRKRHQQKTLAKHSLYEIYQKVYIVVRT